MSATLVYVLRNLGRRRIRTLIGALGIFLTLALLTAIQIGLNSISISSIDLVGLQAGKADLLITREGGDWMHPLGLDAADIASRLKGNQQLQGLAPRWFGIVRVSAGGDPHYAVLLGINPKAEGDLNLSGLVPEPVLGDQSCALSKALAEKLKVKPGASVAVTGPNSYPELTLHLRQIVERQLMLPQQVRDFVVADGATARKLLNEPNGVHTLAGAFRNPRGYYDARNLHATVLRLKAAGAGIASLLGPSYDVRLPKAAALTAFENFTSPLRAVFGVFALLALTITGLLIYSLISVAVEERIREYAILRTLGARRRHIFHLVLSESLVLCFVGVAPGYWREPFLPGSCSY